MEANPVWIVTIRNKSVERLECLIDASRIVGAEPKKSIYLLTNPCRSDLLPIILHFFPAGCCCLSQSLRERGVEEKFHFAEGIRRFRDKRMQVEHNIRASSQGEARNDQGTVCLYGLQQ